MLTGCSPSRAWRPLAVLVVTFHNFLRAPALSSWNSAGAGAGAGAGGREDFPFSLSSLCVWMCFYRCGSLFYPP